MPMGLLPSRSDFLLRSFTTVFLLNAIAGLGGLLLALYAVLTHHSEAVQLLFMQPFRRQAPDYSVFSQLWNLLWCASTTLWLFRLWQSRSHPPHSRLDRFLCVTSLGLLVLLTDEVFRISILLTTVGVPKWLLDGLYGLGALTYGVTFWRQLRAISHVQLLLATGGLLVISSGVDLLELPGQGLPAVLEGVPKLLALLNLTLYSWLACAPSPLSPKRLAWKLNLTALLVLLGLSVQAGLSGQGRLLYTLFQEPQADLPHYGIFVRLTLLLVCAAATLCLFSQGWPNSGRSQRPDRFLRYAAVGLAIWTADSAFRLTIVLDIYGHASKALICLLYGGLGVAGLVWGWSFRHRIQRTAFGLLWVGLGWLAVSGLVTLASVKQHDAPEVLERGTRLLAALNLVAYCWQVACQQVQQPTQDDCLSNGLSGKGSIEVGQSETQTRS